MIDVLLNEPLIFLYGKANSGKTLAMLRIAELYAPYIECIHFYTTTRAKYYKSIITADNVNFHTVSTDEMLIRKLESIEKGCMVLVDDITLLVSGQPAWKALNKSLKEFGFKKLILSMDANPHLVDNNNDLAILRCDNANNETTLLHKSDSLPLDDVIKYMSRKLLLDDYCNMI